MNGSESTHAHNCVIGARCEMILNRKGNLLKILNWHSLVVVTSLSLSLSPASLRLACLSLIFLVRYSCRLRIVCTIICRAHYPSGVKWYRMQTWTGVRCCTCLLFRFFGSSFSLSLGCFFRWFILIFMFIVICVVSRLVITRICVWYSDTLTTCRRRDTPVASGSRRQSSVHDLPRTHVASMNFYGDWNASNFRRLN